MEFQDSLFQPEVWVRIQKKHLQLFLTQSYTRPQDDIRVVTNELRFSDFDFIASLSVLFPQIPGLYFRD